MINLVLLEIMYNFDYKVLASWHVNSCTTPCLVQRREVIGNGREKKLSQNINAHFPLIHSQKSHAHTGLEF